MGEEPLPLWCMPAKVKGLTGPLAVQVVRATSALQAEAIVRRMGLEVQEGSAVVTTEHGSETKFQNPVPLICDLCGYELNGLVVHAGVLHCPEYGDAQLVFARVEENNFKRGIPPIVTLLAVLGFIFIMLVLSILALWIIYIFF